MPRFLLGWLLGLAGAAIGLALCALLFGDNFQIGGLGFVWAILIFALLSALFTWITFRTLRRHAGSIVALTGLISTFLALVVTTWISDSLTITGFWTWIGATVVMWLLGMFIWLLPGPWRNYKKGERAT